MREVRRTNLLTGEHTMIPVIQAIDEMCLCLGPHRHRLRHSPNYQIDIVRRLCSGQELETATHSYCWPTR